MPFNAMYAIAKNPKWLLCTKHWNLKIVLNVTELIAKKGEMNFQNENNQTKSVHHVIKKVDAG